MSNFVSGYGDTVSDSNRTRHLRATLLLACLAQFMVILDVSVVNVALPKIRDGLHFTEQDLQWVVNAYTVTFAGFLLLGGRAADLLGRRRVFVAGLVLFAVSSLAGGFADSQGVLIAARAVQGLGGAVIAPASLSILTTTFTEGAARNRAVGIWGAMGGAGGAAGVLLGGILTSRHQLALDPVHQRPDRPDRRARLAAAARRGPGPQPRTRSFDLPGALSATLGLSLLVLGIVRTDVTGWGSAPTLALIVGGVVVLGVFLAIEGRFARSPLMPLRIFASRTLSAANVVVLLVGGATFGMWFFLSLYLQQVLGYSPDPRRPGVPADDDLHHRRLDARLPAGHPGRSEAAARSFGMPAQTPGLLLFTGVARRRHLRDGHPARQPAGGDRHRLRVRAGHDLRGRGRPARTRRASPRGWSTPPGCSAARSGWPSSPRSPPPTPTTC